MYDFFVRLGIGEEICLRILVELGATSMRVTLSVCDVNRLCAMDVAPPVDQLRALSLNRLDGMQRSTSVVADLPFKCPSYPRLGERQLSSSTALDELSLSPRLSSNANLSQDLDASDLLPVAGSMTEVFPRPPGVALTRSVSVRTTTTCRPLTANNINLLAPTVPAAAPRNKMAKRRQAELTSEQRLPFPECPAAVTGSAVRRSMSCPLRMASIVDGVEARALETNGQGRGGAWNGHENEHLLTTEKSGTRHRRRRSSAFERDVDLRGEVVADLPVALRAQFPDFEPDAPIGCSAPPPPRSTVDDQRRTATTAVAAPTIMAAATVGSRVASGHRFICNDTRLLMPTSAATRHAISGFCTPPMSRCDIQVKCLRWLRDAERQEQQ